MKRISVLLIGLFAVSRHWLPSLYLVDRIIANAQRAIVAGAPPEAEEPIKSVKEVVSTGRFADPLANEYLGLVRAGTQAGYEVLYLNLQNGYATVQVTNDPPDTSILEVQKLNGTWKINP